jgi:hypothetical protein
MALRGILQALGFSQLREVAVDVLVLSGRICLKPIGFFQV